MATDARDLAVALARKGFRDGESALSALKSLGDVPDRLVDQIAGVASPDTALCSLRNIAERMGSAELLQLLESDPELRQRLLVVLGTSEALGDFLVRHPEHVRDLAADELSPVPISLEQRRRQMLEATDADELRIAYYRKLLHIAARDLTALTTFEESSAELSDLAIATLGAALAIAQAAEPGADLCRLTIMAMGKTGGHELNYLSDVDVIFVYEPADGADDHEAAMAATRLASAVMRLCRDHTGEGTIWEVDAEPASRGQERSVGPVAREPRRLLREVGQHVGVPGPAQGAVRGRRRAARPGVPGCALADDLVRQHPAELRDRRPGDAPAGHREHPRRPS